MITWTPLTRAAALLDAVARDSEAAPDFDVPLCCGIAAGRLHGLLGAEPMVVLTVGDDAAAIGDAITEAITLLSGLPTDQLSDPVLDALHEARAAADALARG